MHWSITYLWIATVWHTVTFIQLEMIHVGNEILFAISLFSLWSQEGGQNSFAPPRFTQRGQLPPSTPPESAPLLNSITLVLAPIFLIKILLESFPLIGMSKCVSFHLQSSYTDDRTQSSEQLHAERPPKDEHSAHELLYGVNDVPPWYTCLLLGFQASQPQCSTL